jgi:hypothetical protein
MPRGSRRREEAGIEVKRRTLPRYLVSYVKLAGNVGRPLLASTEVLPIVVFIFEIGC